MSTSLLSYSGILAKVKALESNLLTDDDYEKIASLDTTSDFVNYLKGNKSYAVVFNNCDESKLHRAEIEQLLYNASLLEFTKLYKFANQEQRKGLSFIFFRFEVNIVKSLLQMVFNEKEDYNLLLFEEFFKSHSDLKVKELAASKTIDEFINNLQGTQYYDLFKRLQATSHVTLRDYEVQLDIYYFTKAWKLKDRILTGSNRKIATELYGVQSDLLNLTWIYRSKKYFDIDSTKILASIIPIHYKLKKDEIKLLVEAVSTDEFLKIMQSTYYAKLNQSFQDLTIERLYNQSYQALYKSLSKKFSTSMAPVLRFMYEKELELDLLTTALECIRYKLEPSQTMQYLKH
ncbi:MAG: V-type ATPase subunit [bacterium]|nr:V-type ATPase subunit [bacterium]